MAMLRLRWEVVSDEVGTSRRERGRGTGGARQRLRVVDPGAVAGA
jgi:hypothetical protein